MIDDATGWDMTDQVIKRNLQDINVDLLLAADLGELATVALGRGGDGGAKGQRHDGPS